MAVGCNYIRVCLIARSGSGEFFAGCGLKLASHIDARKAERKYD